MSEAISDKAAELRRPGSAMELINTTDLGTALALALETTLALEAVLALEAALALEAVPANGLALANGLGFKTPRHPKRWAATYLLISSFSGEASGVFVMVLIRCLYNFLFWMNAFRLWDIF